MQYTPFGPFELPRNHKGYVSLDNEERRLFWTEVDARAPDLSVARGCYIYAVRAGCGIRPWYVGKAQKTTFKTEYSNSDKPAWARFG